MGNLGYNLESRGIGLPTCVLIDFGNVLIDFGCVLTRPLFSKVLFSEERVQIGGANGVLPKWAPTF